MKRPRPVVASIVTLNLFLLILVVRDSYAYIDPGTGSYLLQLMLAGLLGLVFTIKIYWHKIKTFLVKLFRMK